MSQKPKIAVVKNLHEERIRANVQVLSSFLKLAKSGELTDVCVVAKVSGEAEVGWNSENELELIGLLEVGRAEVVGVYLSGDDENEPEDDEPDDDEETDEDEEPTESELPESEQSGS